MKSYSVDLRERIVQTLKDTATLTAPDVAKIFKVGVATVYRYLQLDRDLLDHKMHLTGMVATRPHTTQKHR